MTSPSDRLLQAHGLIGERNGLHLWGPLHWGIHAGQAWHLRGANGSGKTTLLRTLAGLRPPLAGHIERPRGPRSVAWLAHQDGWAEEIDGLSNLRIFARLHGLDTAALPALMDELGLTALQRPLRQLSAGQRRKLALVRLRLLAAPLWLLDEPFDALDDAACAWLSQQAHLHLARGGAMLLSSHQRLPSDFPACQHLDLSPMPSPAPAHAQQEAP